MFECFICLMIVLIGVKLVFDVSSMIGLLEFLCRKNVLSGFLKCRMLCFFIVLNMWLVNLLFGMWWMCSLIGFFLCGVFVIE